MNISDKTQILRWFTTDLFFGVADFRLAEDDFFVEALLGEFTVSKADLLVERTLSLVW
ncbi:hypothetical protein P7M43_31260 [Vibrio parahaemolyticus]|nr:hypothetical protein [Vibrio parahaemolyticus]